MVIDTPPGLKNTELAEQLKGADYILIPMLPSWLDICSTADFLRELMVNLKVHRGKARIAIIANRVRKKTKSFQELESFLSQLNIPVLAHLRDTQKYNRVTKSGLGIHEVNHHSTDIDKKDWQSIFNWIEISAKNRSILGMVKEPEMEPVQQLEKLRSVS